MSRQTNIRSGTRLLLQTPSQNSLPPTTPIQASYQSRYIKQILKLQSQKYNYQCQLQQLQQVQNKLIVNDKINSKLKRSKTQLNTKLSSINKEIQNKNKYISIKKKEIRVQKNKQQAIKGYDQLGSFKFEIEEKKNQLQQLKKIIKSLQTTNKGIEKKLLQYSLKGKQKLSQVHLVKMNQLMHQNQRLKFKINKYNSQQLKKQDYLKKKPSSIQLKRKRSLLPEIKSNKQIMGKRHSVGEFSKLESQKDLYTKFLSARKPRSQQKLSKDIQQAQNKQEQIQNKIFLSQQEITKIRSRLNELKHLATPSKIQKARNTLMKSNQLEPKTSSIFVECNLNSKIQRRDWIGRFSGLRFSDSRIIREETRLFKIVYNDIGYYQFCYYPVSNPHQVLNSLLPFDKKDLSVPGKQTSFGVQYPDYVKSLKVRFNRTNNTISEISITSNLGLNAQFPTKIGLTTNKISPDKRKSKTLEHHSLNYVPPEEFVPYTFDIKPNQAPTLMFGSYVVKYDQKHRIVKLCLEGLGVQTIEDYVEEIF